MSFDLFECFEVGFKMNLLRVQPHMLGVELEKLGIRLEKSEKFWDKAQDTFGTRQEKFWDKGWDRGQDKKRPTM